MKLQIVKEIATTESGIFKFDIGKGSRVKHLIFSNTAIFAGAGAYIRYLARSRKMSASFNVKETYDVRDIMVVIGDPLAGLIITNIGYKAYELWDKEVVSEQESYYALVENEGGVTNTFQVDIIYEKPKRGKK